MGIQRGNRLRIGIEALAWGDATGYGRFCREIVSALVRTLTHCSFTLLMEPGTDPPAGCEVVRVRRDRDAFGGKISKLMRLASIIAQAPVDLWFFPSPLHFVPVLSRVPLVITVHDAIPASYPRLIFPSWKDRIAWSAKLRLATLQAARIVTVSRRAQESVARAYRVDEKLLTVIHSAPSAIFRPVSDDTALLAISRRLDVPPAAPVIVYHGAFAPHKNLRALARVFLKLCRDPENAELHLIFLGSLSAGNGAECNALREICRETDRVRFPGLLEDADLALALNRATIAVLPSLEEGFGLTGLEAVACGAPLVCTKSSGVSEVLGDTAVYFDALDEEALYGHLKALIGDPSRRRCLRERGLTRVTALNWETAAKRLAGVFEAPQPPSGAGRGSQLGLQGQNPCEPC